MKEINAFDEAELKAGMRSMYRKVGIVGSTQCLYEILKSANILMEVLKEELANEKSKDLGSETKERHSPNMES